MLSNKTNLQARLKMVVNELMDVRKVANAGNEYVDHLMFAVKFIEHYDSEVVLDEKRLKLILKSILQEMDYSIGFTEQVVACDNEICKYADKYDPIVYPLQAANDFQTAAYNLLKAFDNNDFCDAVNNANDIFPFDRSLDEWIMQAFNPWYESVGKEYADIANKLLYDAEERGWTEFNTSGDTFVWYKNVHCKDNIVRAVGVSDESIVLYRASTETIDNEEFVCNINGNPYAEVYLSERQIKEIYQTQQDYCDYYNTGNECTMFDKQVDIVRVK